MPNVVYFHLHNKFSVYQKSKSCLYLHERKEEQKFKWHDFFSTQQMFF
jgi:hypothetical protein